MNVTPEMLSAVAGGIAGWVVVATVARAGGLRDKALVIGTAAILWVVFQSGVHALESSLVRHLADFFATTYFAFGALVGGVLASSRGRGHGGPRREEY